MHLTVTLPFSEALDRLDKPLVEVLSVKKVI